MKFCRRKRSLFGGDLSKAATPTQKKKGDEIDDFVKVVVTVHPFR